MKTADVVVASAFENLVPRPGAKEVSELRIDIKKHGVRVPIIVNSTGTLIDGHTRLKIAKELGLPDLPSIVQDCGSEPYGEEMAVISLNLHRRHLTVAQRQVMGRALAKIEAERAKERHGAGGPGRKPIGHKVGLIEPQGKSVDIAAAKV